MEAGRRKQQLKVKVEGLRVLIMRDGDHWFAQGLEIDYAAAGDSLKDVQTRFTEGLCLSITEHIRIYGNARKFAKVAPQDEWDKLLQGGAEQYDYSVVSTINFPVNLPEPSELPFNSITFYAPENALSEAAR